jgi:hypothetical protein
VTGTAQIGGNFAADANRPGTTASATATTAPGARLASEASGTRTCRLAPDRNARAMAGSAIKRAIMAR